MFVGYLTYSISPSIEFSIDSKDSVLRYVVRHGVILGCVGAIAPYHVKVECQCVVLRGFSTAIVAVMSL